MTGGTPIFGNPHTMPPTTGIQSAIMWIWPKTMGNQYESMGIRYYNTDFPLPAWIAEGYAPPRSGCDQQLLLQLWDIPQKRGCKQQYCVNERVETVTTPLRIPHVFLHFSAGFHTFLSPLTGILKTSEKDNSPPVRPTYPYNSLHKL